jgi:hypothetical protein
MGEEEGGGGFTSEVFFAAVFAVFAVAVAVEFGYPVLNMGEQELVSYSTMTEV